MLGLLLYIFTFLLGRAVCLVRTTRNEGSCTFPRSEGSYKKPTHGKREEFFCTEHPRVTPQTRTSIVLPPLRSNQPRTPNFHPAHISLISLPVRIHSLHPNPKRGPWALSPSYPLHIPREGGGGDVVQLVQSLGGILTPGNTYGTEAGRQAGRVSEEGRQGERGGMHI